MPAEASAAAANEVESTSDRVIKLIHDFESGSRHAEHADAAKAGATRRGKTAYTEIARRHFDEVDELDSLLHSGGEFNGKTTFVLFTDDYYRDPEKYTRRWERLRDWHAQMAEKYYHAALYPEEPVPPDPPEPR
jgi:hypothetical protein